MQHMFLVILFIIITVSVFYRIVIYDDLKHKADLRNKIYDGKILYVWANGSLCKILSIIDNKNRNILTLVQYGPDGESDPFYCHISAVKNEVMKEDLLLLNIISSDKNNEKVEISSSEEIND